MSQSIRRIEDATPFHAGTDWIIGLVAMGAGAAIVWWFNLPLEFDPNSPTFNPAIILAGVLVGYGLWQVVKAVRVQTMGHRFGASVFEMEGHSPSLGQTLRGRIITARDLSPPGGFLLRLRCIEAVRYSDMVGSRMGKKDPRDVIRWEAERTVASQASSSEGVPVEFLIPRGATKDAGKDRLRWTLEIEATVDGERYEALFGVPVIV